MTTAQISHNSPTITIQIEISVRKGNLLAEEDSLHKALDRHDYQGSGGRSISSMLDFNSGVVGWATTRPAKMIAPSTGNDLEGNPNRRLIRLYMKQWSDGVDLNAEVFKTVERERSKLESPVSSISICLDGTCQSLCENGWQDALCATITLYAARGLRLHTNYTPSSSESGTAGSRDRFEQSLEKLKRFISRPFTLVSQMAVGTTGLC
ncbi:hypothetical protein ACL7TT_03365 [Microbulbifer sp. 2304DJ12-6]|uniref:hypothetical protein n=1 Tax=Microbulbifer sp. 2304DJ12-6 TaxID=3233340 RepID=UPI0039AFD23E